MLAAENNSVHLPAPTLRLRAYPLHDAAVYLHCCRVHLRTEPGAPNRTEEVFYTAVLAGLRAQLYRVKAPTEELRGLPVAFKIKPLRATKREKQRFNDQTGASAVVIYGMSFSGK